MSGHATSGRATTSEAPGVPASRRPPRLRAPSVAALGRAVDLPAVAPRAEEKHRTTRVDDALDLTDDDHDDLAVVENSTSDQEPCENLSRRTATTRRPRARRSTSGLSLYSGCHSPGGARLPPNYSQTPRPARPSDSRGFRSPLTFLLPIARACAAGERFELRWTPGGPWATDA